MSIVEERPDHEEHIGRIVSGAFGGEAEAALVSGLRQSRALAISLVAEIEEEVCGYIALSRLILPARGLALAPLAVAKPKQGMGIGSALVLEAATLARQAGYGIIFALGAPAFYRRFGFKAEVASKFQCRFAGPSFMALEFPEAGVASGFARYPSAFDSW